MDRLKYSLTKPWFSHEESKAATKVLESGWIAEGKATEHFEQRLAQIVGARYAVAVCNCTVALELALRAHGIHGEVAIPDFTHSATPLAVINAGCKPVLVDVSLETFNYANHTGHSPIVSMPVSWGGNPIVEYPRCFIIEDAACSLGTSYRNVKTGSQFTTCFSFHPRKLVTCGETGAVVTNDEEIAEKVRALKWFGKDGGNYKVTDILTAIGIVQLGRLKQIVDRRREMAKIYDDLLEHVNGVDPPSHILDSVQTFQTYGVLVKKASRDRAIRKLAVKGIETQIGTTALHCLPQFAHLKRYGKLERSETLYRRMLALPMAYDMTEEDQKLVVAELKNELA